MQDRKFGYFQIHHDLMDTRPDIVRFILKDVIVLEAGWKDTESISYLGHHPSFDFVPVGADVPWYIPDVIFSEYVSTPTVKWVRTSQPKPKTKLADVWTQADMAEPTTPAVNFEPKQARLSPSEGGSCAVVVEGVPPERLTDPFERQRS